MNTISLVEDGDLNVYNNYLEVDEKKFYPPPPEDRAPDFVGISAPFPLPPQVGVTPARPDTEWYSSHMPGLSVVILPGGVVGSGFGQGWPGPIVVMCILGAEMAINHHTRSLPVLLIIAAVGVFGSISIARFVARKDNVDR